jgi:hypothetical protein
MLQAYRLKHCDNHETSCFTTDVWERYDYIRTAMNCYQEWTLALIKKSGKAGLQKDWVVRVLLI